MARFFQILSAGAVVGLLPGLASAALIFSESFESPTLGSPSASYSPATTAGPWSSSTGNLLVYGSGNYGNPFGGTQQYLVTDPSNGPSGGTISWNFNVGVGTYTLTFDHLNYGTPTTTQSLDITVSQFVTGDLLTTNLSDASSGTPGAITTFTDTFTTTSAGSVTLELTDSTASATSNAKDMLIDNIQVNGPSPVPEPATLGVLVAGGAMLLRKRRGV